jgi:spermidine synthase
MPKSATLYPITIFLSAFLLFLIQPMIARRILPAFGGSTAVWTTCMLMFQLLLLAGYFYADRVARMRPGGRMHAGILTASLLPLPYLWSIDPARWSAPGTDPALGVIAVLSLTVGAQYFLLSTTGPLVQSWFAREFRAETPYRLYAISNIGSFLGLVAYPLAIEPALGVADQLRLWAGGYALLVLFCGFIGWRSARWEAVAGTAGNEEPIPWNVKIWWLIYPAIASALLLSVTNHMTQNVTPVPFLWVLTLTLYLLTFVFCFDRRTWYRPAVFHPLAIVSLASMGYGLAKLEPGASLFSAVPLFALGLFFVCMYLHGETAARKPASGRLTEFYLMLALGSAGGAMLVALVAPRTLDGIYEFPIALTLCALVALFQNYRRHWITDIAWAASAVIVVSYSTAEVQAYASDSRVRVRNFYGALRVHEKNSLRSIMHGVVNHGNQSLKSESRREPTTYYGRTSGVGLAIEQFRRPGFRVGLIGLGAGTLAAYSRKGEYFRFYEINPQVLDLAEREFTYLRDAEGAVEVVIGDGRLMLEREDPQNFDLIVLDAFSGDSIPVHLLTREAMALYARHLAPHGAIACHISNMVLDLRPVVAANAKAMRRPAWFLADPGVPEKNSTLSFWALIPMDSSVTVPRFERLQDRAGLPQWTDDYSNLIQILRR